MRVTTQMLNETARKAGIPIHTTSMIDYALNGQKANALPFDRWEGETAENLRRTKAYEKQEEAAERLDAAAMELAGTGERSIYDRENTPENKAELDTKIKELVKQYNEVLSGFEGSGGLMDTFYRKSLKSLTEDHAPLLKAIGVTADQNGRLTVDEKKLSSADVETIRRAFAGTDGFAESLSFLSAKIADYAASNQNTAGNLYRQDGSEAAAVRYAKNRYDAWG